MLTGRKTKHCWLGIGAGFALAFGLAFPVTKPQAQAGGNPGVIPPNARPHGLTYNELSANWSKWGLELPVDGHPFLGCPDTLSAGQSGPVWFLAGGPTECGGTVPTGKALFFPLANAECSTLEPPPFHGDTDAEQRSCAKFWADHIVVSSLFCEVDGVPTANLGRYRFASPQYQFTAPTPWVFGDLGGPATAVSDGYYLLLPPLSRGAHTIHFGGASHFSIDEGDDFDADFGIDTTYHLIVR